MLGFLKKKLQPISGAREEESPQALYEEFGRTFCHKPGVNFMQSLRDQGVTRMIAWLRPETECALPKGFVRLAVDATRKGYKIWEQPGIDMAYEGNWSNGGLPPQESLEALSVLAQILELAINLYYTEIEGGEQRKMEFQP